LVEVRCVGNPSDEEVARFQADSVAALAACVAETKRLAVACPDFRGATLLRPTACDRIIDLMKRDNRSVERSAILAARSATFTLQLTRFMRESASESRRRVFTEVEQLYAWLDEVLTSEERTRLRQFVAELGDEESSEISGARSESPAWPSSPAKPRTRLR
jgi:type II secretory pathway predicted ATPase ExeA